MQNIAKRPKQNLAMVRILANGIHPVSMSSDEDGRGNKQPLLYRKKQIAGILLEKDLGVDITLNISPENYVRIKRERNYVMVNGLRCSGRYM